MYTFRQNKIIFNIFKLFSLTVSAKGSKAGKRDSKVEELPQPNLILTGCFFLTFKYDFFPLQGRYKWVYRV